MSEEWIGRLSRRGEQLTRAVIQEHAPELAAPSGIARVLQEPTNTGDLPPDVSAA
jgi:hypothetical protein